jgi:hypothetical protein
MLGYRYIELNSTYRNRILYPNPSDFIVQISQSGQKDKYNAIEPISDTSPILSWNNSFCENSDRNEITGLTTAFFDTSNSLFTASTFTVTSGDGGQLRAVNGFYVGATLYDVKNVYTRVITNYEYIGTVSGNNAAIITVDRPLGDGISNPSFNIINPTPIPTNTANTVIQFFVPGSTGADNFYNGYYIQAVNGGDLVTPQYFPITAYDSVNHLITINTGNAGTAQNWAGSSADINFVIRKVIPTITGTIPDNPAIAVSTTGTAIQLPSNASAINEFYKNSWLRMIQPFPTTVTGFSTPAAPYGQENKIVRYIADSGVFVSASTNVFTLSSSASTLDNYYVGAFITTSGNLTYLVTSYTGSTRSGTISVNWGVVPTVGSTWIFRTVFLETKYTAPPVDVTNNFEIELFSRDNVVPFFYTGSLTSVTEMRCYDVELLNLGLPNADLISCRGGRPVFYPYFYVELQNVSSSGAGNRGAIYSNNPNAVKMIFRATVDDTTIPANSPFVKIDGDGMVQRIKFRPTDNLHFAIYHSTGELFQSSVMDTIDPTAPNPLAQISACFSFREAN